MNQTLNILEQFVYFYEAQDLAGHVDGAYDPFAAVEGAKAILDEHRPGWRKQDPALGA